jgi:glutathione S-transferase
VLQYVADHFPAAGLAPVGGPERYRLQQWLNFIGTELHKGTYIPLLDENAPAGAKDYARDKAALRLGYLDRHFAGHEFLLEKFSVADAYLVTVLNWSQASGIDLGEWPNVLVISIMTKRRASPARLPRSARFMRKRWSGARRRNREGTLTFYPAGEAVGIRLLVVFAQPQLNHYVPGDRIVL